MTGIVDRLRTRYKVMCRRCLRFNCDMTLPHEVMDEAAAEIARLERIEAAAKDWVTNCYEADGVSYQVGWDTEQRLVAAVRGET